MEKSLLYYKYIDLLDCDKLDRLSNIVKKSFSNHLLIVGNKGCGKMNFVNKFLNNMNNGPLNIKSKKETIKVKSKNLEFNIFYSNMHIDIDLSLFSKLDKNIISMYINDVTETKPVIDKYEHNIIVLRHFDKISPICYQTLLRLFEIRYDTTRFICVCDNLNKIDNALLSRFFIIRIPRINILNNLKVIIGEEGIKISNNNLNDLIDISNNNYREVLYRLDSYKNGGNIYTNTELNISKAVKLLKNNDIKVLILIRELLYIVISNNLDYNDIINKLRYFINKEINNKYLAKINNLIYEMERKMQISVRQFYYIEHIIIGAYYIIHNKEKN